MFSSLSWILELREFPCLVLLNKPTESNKSLFSGLTLMTVGIFSAEDQQLPTASHSMLWLSHCSWSSAGKVSIRTPGQVSSLRYRKSQCFFFISNLYSYSA